MNSANYEAPYVSLQIYVLAFLASFVLFFLTDCHYDEGKQCVR